MEQAVEAYARIPCFSCGLYWVSTWNLPVSFSDMIKLLPMNTGAEAVEYGP